MTRCSVVVTSWAENGAFVATVDTEVGRETTRKTIRARIGVSHLNPLSSGLFLWGVQLR